MIGLDQVEIKQKEIYTFKKGKVYYGVVNSGDSLYITSSSYDTALKAANKARSLKKQNSISSKVIVETQPKSSSTFTVDKPVGSIRRKSVKFYSDADMSDPTLASLKLREVWCVKDKKTGKWVSSTLTKESVADYATSLGEAEFHGNYENALSIKKLLDSMIGPGHELRRFYVERNKVKCKEDYRKNNAD